MMQDHDKSDPAQPAGHRLLVQLPLAPDKARDVLVRAFGAEKGNAAVIVPGSREWERDEHCWKYSAAGCRAYLPNPPWRL